MEPDELEFIGEKEMIGIIPNFNFDLIHLISGTIGPFRAGLPMHIPIWLAMHLKRQQKCRIVPPNWMEKDLLEDLKEEEKRTANFVKMPDSNFMIVSKLIFAYAAEEVADIEEIKTIIKDIFDTRQAKLRTAMDGFFVEEKTTQFDGSTQVSFTNLTTFEIHSARPFLPYALDLVARLERVCQQQQSNLNETHNSSSHFSSSYY
ncbi:hypothetical protein PVAND_010603 [Polypedilum vanderplanki]|uniref:DNA replication complex GINS protein PSF2 n=1 Tax=Polypedilum vanderplanki TaxID=319348 RepID=A0A9J6CGZ0_POLVA|nr:hypothetical protein PVAND_010603 [Polypedilum vanderplanki]